MRVSMDDVMLWRGALGEGHSAGGAERLRLSFLSFRARVEMLIQSLGAELPGLTVHDITHLDALWRVADQIAGESYPLNPAEAFVLGGAILLHDAAHVAIAYPGGQAAIKATTEWTDFVWQQFSGQEPPEASEQEKAALFMTLRHLHSKQAHRLASMSWVAPTGDALFLIEDTELRYFYGDLIGEIASSHHWPTHKVASEFADRIVSAPSFLPSSWEVDAMKIAFLLRTADAAHLDDKRAPWFLFALRQPKGISADHWHFQARMGQPVRSAAGQLRLTAGAPFPPEMRRAWWLAFDTAQMIDKELHDAAALMKEHKRPVFAVHGVDGAQSPQAFARCVRVRGWEPQNVRPVVGNLPKLIQTLGGRALYTDVSAALRELLQNGMDAVRSYRCLGGLNEKEGEIVVSLDEGGDGKWWLRVTDDGIGMSRFVLTNVLLDFGTSLWNSDKMREELPGLATSGFEPIGKFGIGFYATFMLGDQVRVTSRRFETPAGDRVAQWSLHFDEGLDARPILMQASDEEKLTRSGTSVSVELSTDTLRELLSSFKGGDSFLDFDAFAEDILEAEVLERAFCQLVAWLCPSSDIKISVRLKSREQLVAVLPDDWVTITDEELLKRVRGPSTRIFPLCDIDGALIGRLGLHRWDDSIGAALTHQGVRAGRLPRFAGMCKTGGNNLDAGRTMSEAAGSNANWRAWAENYLVHESRLSQADLLQLHRCIPERDLRLWRIDSKILTLAQLGSHLSKLKLIYVHSGRLTREDDDDVGEGRFDEFFLAHPNVVEAPNLYASYFAQPYAWNTSAGEIDYLDRFTRMLEGAWGAYVEDSDHVCVGKVEGTEIFRDVSVFLRDA